LNIKIKYKNKFFLVKARKTNFISKFTGLMFKTRNTGNLLFDFGKEINISFHSFFVFFPFIILWLDSKNNVLDWKIVRPFSFSIRSKRPFRKVLEIFLNNKSEISNYFLNFRRKKGKV